MICLKNKDFLKLLDFTPEEIAYLLELAADLKAKKKAGIPHALCQGKNIALIFEKTSTRTRCAFEVAGHDLGMGVTYLDPTGSQIGKKESIADTARVLSRMFVDFDDVSRGYGHARHMGNVVAGAVLQVFDKVTYLDVDTLKALQKTIQISSNMPSPEQLPEARRIEELHQAGRDCDIPYEGMMLTTVVAEAERMLKLADGPEHFDMKLSGIAIGPIAMIGIPGEPFTGIGRALKQAPGWTLVLPTCLTNGSDGYFPMQDAYDEGGYEARSSPFKAGVAERIISEGTKLLAELQR